MHALRTKRSHAPDLIDESIINQENNMGMEVGGLLGLIWLFLVIWAIVKVAQSPAGPVPKLLWILVLLFLPVIGLIAWFLLGPKP